MQHSLPQIRWYCWHFQVQPMMSYSYLLSLYIFIFSRLPVMFPFIETEFLLLTISFMMIKPTIRFTWSLCIDKGPSVLLYSTQGPPLNNAVCLRRKASAYNHCSLSGSVSSTKTHQSFSCSESGIKLAVCWSGIVYRHDGIIVIKQ